MGPSVRKEVLVLAPGIDQLAAAIEDHQRMLVEPALLVYLGADTFQEAERPPFDVASCGHFAHVRLLPAHEDEHAIFRLCPHGRYRTPGPSVGMYRQRPVLDVLVRSGDIAAAFLLRDDSVTVRYDSHQATNGCRNQNPFRPAPLHHAVLLLWTALDWPRTIMARQHASTRQPDR